MRNNSIEYELYNQFSKLYKYNVQYYVLCIYMQVGMYTLYIRWYNRGLTTDNASFYNQCQGGGNRKMLTNVKYLMFLKNIRPRGS